MKTAVLSDIHGNMEALNAVFEDMAAHNITSAVSLGDNIGYGPAPDAVVTALHRRGIPSVLGNHEGGILSARERRWFNPTARSALLLTDALLSEESRRTIATYPAFLVAGHARFVHGCPPDRVRTYLFEVEDFAPVFASYPESICFVGHTHELAIIRHDGQEIIREDVEKDTICFSDKERLIVNAGSIGQPRDGDNRAKYLIYDGEKKEIQIRKIPYDIAKTAGAILAAGLPEPYANRLW